MSSLFQIRIEFLQVSFHGRCDAGEPEWPPSPLRLFQALTAASAARWNERDMVRTAAPALEWLESLKAPSIHATGVRLASPYRLYVPNNTADLVAKSWVKGNDNSIAKYRSEKDVQPLVPAEHQDEKLVVVYRWEIDEPGQNTENHIALLAEATSAITHLGWGIDQVVAAGNLWDSHASEDDGLEEWEPIEGVGPHQLRIPVPGTFAALGSRFERFLARLEDNFLPVPPLTTMRLATYKPQSESSRKVTVAFALRPIVGPGNFRAYDPIQEGVCVSAMIRHILNGDEFQRRLGWPSEDLPFLHGHGESGESNSHQPVNGARLAILPIPSLEFRGNKRGTNVGSIRRVLLTVSGENRDKQLSDLSAYLSGHRLLPEHSTIVEAVLSPISPDSTVHHYTAESSIWATVTPIVLPGFDDPGKLRRKLSGKGVSKLSSEGKEKLVRKLAIRTEKLLRRAIQHAGFSESLARHAELEWSGTGYWPGTTHARKYFVPNHLQKFPRYHVRIRWRDSDGNPVSVRGPICLGGGRFIGTGLLAPEFK